MINAIRPQYNFQSPQIGNLRTKQAFDSQVLSVLNYQRKDVVNFGNKETDIEKAKKEGCYDPHRTVVTALPAKNTNDATGIPTEKVIEAMKKSHIAIKYETNLEDILDGNKSNRDQFKPSDSILKEIAIAINNNGNITTKEAMAEEIQNNIKPYMLKEAYRVFDGNLNGRDKVKYPDWQQLAALSQMIGDSKNAKENPDPWVVILDHLMNDSTVYRNDISVRRKAAEALCHIGNNPKHLEIFDRCKKTSNDAFLNGIASAGENMIKARIAENADSNSSL